jgi:hypothetical protein
MIKDGAAASEAAKSSPPQDECAVANESAMSRDSKPGISTRRYFANHADFEIWLYSRPAAVEFVPWRIWKPALRKELVQLENEAHFSPSVFASNSRDSRTSENAV